MSSVVNAVGDVVGGIGDAVGGVVKEVGKVGQGVIDTAQSLVKQVEKNPLTAAALIAGGYAFAPELGAWIGSDGTALAGTAEGVTAGTVPTTQSALASQAVATPVATGSVLETALPLLLPQLPLLLQPPPLWLIWVLWVLAHLQRLVIWELNL
jgi:hypothetical protein